MTLESPTYWSPVWVISCISSIKPEPAANSFTIFETILLPSLNLEPHLFEIQLHNTLSPPSSKYLCWDISGEGTSAELMQCVRSRVMQRLPSPAALESCRTALRPSSGRALNCCSPLTLNIFHHILAQHSITCCSTVVCDAQIDSQQYCSHI